MALLRRGFCEGDNSVDGRDRGRAGRVGSLRTSPAVARGGRPLHYYRARARRLSRAAIRGGTGGFHRGLLEKARSGSAHALERVPGRALPPHRARQPSPWTRDADPGVDDGSREDVHHSRRTPRPRELSRRTRHLSRRGLVLRGGSAEGTFLALLSAVLPAGLRW